MAQTGFTPIQLYSSSTPTNAPSASNLTNDTKGSELAINIADKNLFFKDSTNTVNTVPIRQSGASSNGWLSSTDWNTFNNKQPAGTYVTSVTGTAPVVSSGGTTPAISMAAATTSVNGYLTSTDWNTFNGKQAALVSGTNIKTVNGTTLLGSGDLGTIGVAYGGTGLTSLTAGYIPFGAGTSAFGNSANLFWDSGNTRLGVGTNAPNATIRAIGASGGVQFGAGTSGNAVFINAFDSNPIYMTASASNSTAFGIGSASNIPFFFMSNNTERMRVHTSGGVSIGNTTDPGAGILSVASGVRFPATQVASADANTLDDYEEGTFTPVVTAASGSITSYNASGTYVKIGKTVTIQMTFNITNPGTASGLVNFSSLPFTSQNVTNYAYEGRTRENNQTGSSFDFLIVANNTTGIILTSTWASNQSYSLAGTYITA